MSDDHMANVWMRGMERHLKIIIFTIIFLVATSGYAEEYVQLEDDNSSATAQELATERWMKMRQQPDLTETSGTERSSVLIRKAATSKAKALSKSKTAKNVKSPNKREGMGEAGKALGEADKDLAEAGKAKSPLDVGKAKAPEVAGKAKSPEGASKAKAPDGGGKTKSSTGTGKAKSLDDSTNPED